MAVKTWITLILIVVSVLGLLPRSWFMTIDGQQRSISQGPDPSRHRTYLLAGDTLFNWNGSRLNSGPWVNASDGDTLTLMLLSNDTAIHNWYLDFNKDLVIDPNEVPTVSPNFRCNTYCLNFTFGVFLGQGNHTTAGVNYVGIPHGGTFTYRCSYHPSMFGNFRFNSGPVASFTHSPNTPLAGNQVSFDASSSWQSTNASKISNYSWSFGDMTANSTTSKTTTHTYAASGNYSVTLNITDNLVQKASTNATVRILTPPPIPFDYQILITPKTLSLQAGRNSTVNVNLILISGTTENVTVAALISPHDSLESTRIFLNRTSGFPSFSALLRITTSPSSPCYLDPCLLNRTITVTIIAVSDTGVDHNATLMLNLTPTPVQPAPNYLPLATYVTIAVASVGIGALLVRRSRIKRLQG